ncbi:MAG: glycerol-3-phosphate 1-O-acyltransferase PlsY [Planctomycetaceae bacterium]
MSSPTSLLLAPLLAYLIGSLPFGLVIARRVAGIDVRRAGSGNIGATNVARVVGWKWGAAVLLLDVLKGALPTLLLPLVLPPADAGLVEHQRVACGLAAILGHMFPVWLGFRGGKGVATALGVVLVLGPVAAAIALAVFAVLMGTTRIVSLSAILGSLAFAAAQLWRLRPAPFDEEHWSLAAFSIMVPALIIVRHRANIARLLRGEEERLRPRGERREEGSAGRPDDDAADQSRQYR